MVPVVELAQHTSRFCCLSRKQLLRLFHTAVSEWNDDKAPRLGASLAFYTLLSIAPLLVVSIAIAGLVFGKKAAEGQLFWQIRGFLGNDGAVAIQNLIQGAGSLGKGVVSIVLGVVTLLFAASSVVLELSDALNTIWHVKAPAAPARLSLVTTFLRERAWSICIVFGTGLLLLLALVAGTAIGAMGRVFHSSLPEVMVRITGFLAEFFVTTFLFAAIYKFVPATRLRWTDVFIGAIITAMFFTAGNLLIGLYLSRTAFSSIFGAAGSLVAVLVWVYYSAQLFFLGAEFTKVYTNQLGSRQPEPG